MGRIDRDLSKLTQKDFYSILLFTLYKLEDIPEYSSLSQLVYTLDKDSMLKLLEVFGGQTIKIPTITELESLVYSLLLYQYVNIEHMDFSQACQAIGSEGKNMAQIKKGYREMVNVLKNYSFGRDIQDD